MPQEENSHSAPRLWNWSLNSLWIELSTCQLQPVGKRCINERNANFKKGALKADFDRAQKKLTKFKESAWKCLYFFLAEVFVLAITYNEPWFTDSKMFWVGPGEQQWPHLMTRWFFLFPNVPVLVLQPSSIAEVISGVFVLQRICSSWHQDQQLQCSWRLLTATVIGLYACLHLWLRSWWSQWGRMSSCHWQLVTFKYAVFWSFSFSGISWTICLSISSSFPFVNCVCILVGLGAGSSWKFCMALLGDSIHTASLLWYSGRHDVQILVSVCHTTLFLFSLLSSLTLPGFPLILFPLPVPPPAGFGEVFLVWSV